MAYARFRLEKAIVPGGLRGVTSRANKVSAVDLHCKETPGIALAHGQARELFQSLKASSAGTGIP